MTAETNKINQEKLDEIISIFRETIFPHMIERKADQSAAENPTVEKVKTAPEPGPA